LLFHTILLKIQLESNITVHPESSNNFPKPTSSHTQIKPESYIQCFDPSMKRTIYDAILNKPPTDKHKKLFPSPKKNLLHPSTIKPLEESTPKRKKPNPLFLFLLYGKPSLLCFFKTPLMPCLLNYSTPPPKKSLLLPSHHFFLAFTINLLNSDVT